MKNFLKQNLALVLAFGLPVLLVIGIAVSAYLPGMFVKTSYNFLYASCSEGRDYYSHNCGFYLEKRYTVVNGKITVNPIDPAQDSDGDKIPDFQEGYGARLFLHDTLKNESREVTLEEAQKLTVNGLLTSPDGINVTGATDRGANFFLFFDAGSSSGYYLTKGKARSKLNLIHQDRDYYYQDNFRFIGWVLPGRNK